MIFITGASGFVGSHLLPRLREAGHNVRCLVRSESEAEHVRSLGASTALGDVTNPDSLSEVLDGVKTIIHLVAILREGHGATFGSVNVTGTKNMLKAAKTAGIKRFIHISAMGAKEDPHYPYFHSKWQGEKAVRASGLDFTIFRPGAMFGEGGAFIDKMADSVSMLPIITPVAGPGKSLFQPIWVEDVVTCILKAVEGQKVGETCEIGGPEHLSYGQILDEVMLAMGKKRIKFHIPMLLMRPGAAVLQRILSHPPVTTVELTSLGMDNIGQPDSVESQFGFKPKSIKEGLGYLKPR